MFVWDYSDKFMVKFPSTKKKFMVKLWLCVILGFYGEVSINHDFGCVIDDLKWWKCLLQVLWSWIMFWIDLGVL